MEFNVQNLEYAVSVFYNSEQQNRIQAHQWLSTAQRCPEAWSFVWDLLQIGKSTEVQFFASTTLHTKILRCWSELPAESHEELKDKILQTIFALSKGPKIVINRLCISLAAYVMQQTTSDLATILRPLSSQEHISILLEVLNVIPEEFGSMTMGSHKRNRNKALLQQACPAVLDDMLRHLQSVYSKDQPSEETIQLWISVATCSGSWLGLSTSDACPVTLAECLPLCHALIQVVHVIFIWNEAVSDSGLEVCEAALGAVRAAATAPDSVKFPNAALELMTAIASLAIPILARDNVPNSMNEELVASILTCGVALGEAHSCAIVKSIEEQKPHEGAWQFLELLMAGQGSPGYYPIHETRSQFVFGFWYTLQDELMCYFDNTKKVNEKWRCLFTRLLNTLIEKSETPSEENMTRDDAELLRCYRQDIADAVMYCYGILEELCWNIVDEAWKLAANDDRREAVLHVFLALADADPQQRAPPILRDMLASAIETAATTSHSRLLNTSLECIGAFSCWLASFKDPNKAAMIKLTRDALQAAGAALQKAPQSAALALKKISTECSESAAPLAREITSVALNPNVTSDQWVRKQLLGAAGAALAASDIEVAGPLLKELADSITKDLMLDVSDSKTQRGGADQAAALMFSLSGQVNLAITLFVALLPILPMYAVDPLLVPSLFQMLRQSVTVLGDESVPFLENISTMAERAISIQPCATGHEFVTLLVQMFEKQYPSGCAHLLRSSIMSGARMSHADAANNCDITQALFTSLHTITKKQTQLIDTLEDVLPELIDLAYECIRLWESNAARAACWFLSVLVEKRPHAVQHKAPEIIVMALRCIGGAIPRHQVEPLAEVLLSMNKVQWESGGMSVWLAQALQPEGFPTTYATTEYKQKFMSAVLKEKSNKRRLLESVQEFSLVCRGVITTEYAKQSLSSKLAMP